MRNIGTDLFSRFLLRFRASLIYYQSSSRYGNNECWSTERILWLKSKEVLMPRQAWGIVSSFPHRIVQLGRNRQSVLIERCDLQYYLANLKEWKQVYALEVFSYCLMRNHIQLFVQASNNVTPIPKLMKRLAGRQIRFGTENRHRSIIVGI